MEKKKILIDCDPGIDDALALMLALRSPELEIVGVTTVCGNVPPEKGAYNVLRVLDFMGRTDIPVFCGAERPLVRDYINAEDTHGADGLGESGLPLPDGRRFRRGAVSFILDTLQKEKDVTILAIGPLTNIALALRQNRDAFANLRALVSMGGSYKSHGNCSPVAEYNYWCDPDAARLVFETLHRPIHMVGLDVTRKIVLTPNILEYMRTLNVRIGSFISGITRFYLDFHWKQEGVIGCVINDPLAVAYLIDPTLCGGFDAYTTIETAGGCIGQSVVDAQNFWRREPNSRILTSTRPLDFFSLFLSRVFRTSPSETAPVLSQIMVSGGETL